MDIGQTRLAIGAAVTLYVVWFALQGLSIQPPLVTAIFLDVGTRIALPMVLLLAICKFGKLTPSRYWLVSPFASKRGKEVLALMLTSVLLLLTYILVANVVGGFDVTKSTEGAQQSAAFHPFLVAVLIIYFSASASFSEEVFFRGIPRLVFTNVSNAWIRNLGFLFLSSTLFACMHLPYGAGSAIAAGYFGVVAGSILIWTNNLWYPLVGHLATNSLVMYWTYARVGALPV